MSNKILILLYIQIKFLSYQIIIAIIEKHFVLFLKEQQRGILGNKYKFSNTTFVLEKYK